MPVKKSEPSKRELRLIAEMEAEQAKQEKIPGTRENALLRIQRFDTGITRCFRVRDLTTSLDIKRNELVFGYSQFELVADFFEASERNSMLRRVNGSTQTMWIGCLSNGQTINLSWMAEEQVLHVTRSIIDASIFDIRKRLNLMWDDTHLIDVSDK